MMGVNRKAEEFKVLSLEKLARELRIIGREEVSKVKN